MFVRKSGGNKKGALLLTVAAAGTLVAVSSLSLSAFAQSTLDDKQDVVVVEAQPPQTAAPAAEATLGTVPLVPVSKTLGMTADQAAPYIRAAEEALKASNVELPESGYWVRAAYFADRAEVEVHWFPNSWEDLGPWDDLGPVDFIQDTTYFVHFGDVNLQAGSGVADTVRVIRPGEWEGPSAGKDASS